MALVNRDAKQDLEPHVLPTEVGLAALSHPALLLLTAWPGSGLLEPKGNS